MSLRCFRDIRVRIGAWLRVAALGIGLVLGVLNAQAKNFT